MNKLDKLNMTRFVQFILDDWNRLHIQADGNSWHNRSGRQMCRDCLTGLARFGFIEADFNMNKIITKWGDTITPGEHNHAFPNLP